MYLWSVVLVVNSWKSWSVYFYVYIRTGTGWRPMHGGGVAYHHVVIASKISILRHKIDVQIIWRHFLSVNYWYHYSLQWFICPLSKYRQAHVSKIWHRVNLLTAKHTPSVNFLTYHHKVWHICNRCDILDTIKIIQFFLSYVLNMPDQYLSVV